MIVFFQETIVRDYFTANFAECFRIRDCDYRVRLYSFLFASN